MDTFGGTRLEMVYGGAHRVDGEAIDYDAYPLMDAPGVQAPLASGRATFCYGADTLSLDFEHDPNRVPVPMRVIG